MLNMPVAQRKHVFVPGAVVKLAEELFGVQEPNGLTMARDTLGPGIVEKVAADGRVRVRWMDAEFDAWMRPDDLHPYGRNAHLITIYRCDGGGHNYRLHNKVVQVDSLEHNWRVELRPESIVRTVRDDGAAWTFRLNPALHYINHLWPQPPEDADAEALVAAELGAL